VKKTYRQIYEEANGPIPEGYEIHHKLPKRLGGTDDLDNLECLSRSQHSIAHLKLYEIYGDKRDLFAHYMLSGDIKMGRAVAASIGGKIGGKLTYDIGLGFHGANSTQRSEWGRMGGKIGGNIQLKEGLGIHTSNSELRIEWARMGGRAGPFANASFQSLQGSKGGNKNAGYVWITNGTTIQKYTAKMQCDMSLEDFLVANPGYRKGRK
jgi:hypothetical protein